MLHTGQVLVTGKGRHVSVSGINWDGGLCVVKKMDDSDVEFYVSIATAQKWQPPVPRRARLSSLAE